MFGKRSLKDNLTANILITGASIWAVTLLGAPVIGTEIQLWPAIAILIALLGASRVLIRLLQYLIIFIDWQSTRTTTGRSGTSSWAKKKDYKKELTGKKQGPFWGVNAARDKTPLFFDYVSNALTIAPAGSGKGICTVVPMIMSILHSKIIPDFKGDLVCMLKKALEKRGEIVRVLNPSGQFKEIIGESDSYNPIDIIADDLNRPGGLRDVMDDLREMTSQILPEPAQGESENTYFREGSRGIKGLGILIEAMIEGYDATLSSVSILIEDQTRLEDHLRWIAGVDINGKPHPDGAFPIEQAPWAQNHPTEEVSEFAKLIRAKANNLLTLMSGDDRRTFDSFITGAQQALAPFAFGRLAPCMGRSTFKMDDLKNSKKAVTLFIVSDASRPEAYKPFTGLIQWCCMTAMKRNKNKDRPVYFIQDEATNYKIYGLESLLTWGRSYGIRIHVIFQAFAAFERVYGKEALETLLSETEIKQFLPGQRSPKTLELISKKILGEQSVISANMSLAEKTSRLKESLSEAGRVLMTEDEIRRTDKGILIVRRNKPILFDPVSYAEIYPWRNQVGINPFYGKAFRKKIKLRL